MLDNGFLNRNMSCTNQTNNTLDYVLFFLLIKLLCVYLIIILLYYKKAIVYILEFKNIIINYAETKMLKCLRRKISFSISQSYLQYERDMAELHRHNMQRINNLLFRIIYTNNYIFEQVVNQMIYTKCT